jgi:hypothetical protein
MANCDPGSLTHLSVIFPALDPRRAQSPPTEIGAAEACLRSLQKYDGSVEVDASLAFSPEDGRSA